MIGQQPKMTQMILTQDDDSCSGGEVQELAVHLEDAGGGDYYVIKTNRWAFDSIEDLIRQIGRLKAHAELEGGSDEVQRNHR